MLFAIPFIVPLTEMKSLLLSLVVLACGLLPASAQTTWHVAQGPSSVDFYVTHFYFTKVHGQFRYFSGTLSTSGEDFSDAKISVRIPVEGVYTGIPARDRELQKEHFFHTDAHPDLFFESRSFTKTGGDVYEIEGMLTMRGVSLPITLEATYLGERLLPSGKRRADFTATGSLDRFEYGLCWNKVAEFGQAIVGRKVDISLDIVLFAKPTLAATN